MEAPTIADKTWFVDVEYKGLPRLIACGVLETDAGLLLVDPGPTVSLATLEQKLEAQGTGFADVHGLLLTHIHLDHAGATGVIVDTYPHVQVYVHQVGARHMIRPERLLASAHPFFRHLIPSANEQPEVFINDASHFLQEDQGEEIAEHILAFIARTS